MFLRFIAIALIAFFTHSAVAQNAEAPDELSRLKEEIARRRALLKDAIDGRGMVYEPVLQAEAWFTEPRDLKIESEAIIMCGQTFATLSRKEVMVSGRVARKQISVSEVGVRADKALDALRRAIEAQGVAIIPIGARTLVLIDAAEVTK